MQKEYGKFFPGTLVLETTRVTLRLMQLTDMEALSAIAGPPEIWKYFTYELNKKEELQQWMEAALQERAEGKRMPFVIINKDSDTICGCTSFGNISFYDKRIEIGWTWLGTASMGTGVNHHAKFILLSYAFDALRFERVEIKTDRLNERARAALVHIGATEEGILRSHMQMPHNRRRDSVYYSILKDDWETVKMLYFGDVG
ncbi:MAG TPA: GNAT family N-acetyltransferase [Chitinophagaceae bacterium]|nr:GNAT family N-acetyltransferase [Chitinophagaceae bacterium]